MLKISVSYKVGSKVKFIDSKDEKLYTVVGYEYVTGRGIRYVLGGQTRNYAFDCDIVSEDKPKKEIIGFIG